MTSVTERFTGAPIANRDVLKGVGAASAIFAIARPAWSYPLDPAAMEGAQRVAKRLGLVA